MNHEHADNEEHLSEEEKRRLATPDWARGFESGEKTNEQLFEQFAEEIQNFKNEDANVEKISSAAHLENTTIANEVKVELGLDGKLAGLNAEADQLGEKAKEELDENSPEYFEKDESLEKRYKREFMPMLEIMCPEGMTLEEYEAQVREDLFEDVKKIQTAQGRLLEDPEKTLDEAKTLFESRIKASVRDAKDKKGDLDFIIKGKAALVVAGELSEDWNTGEHYENQRNFRYDQDGIAKELKSLFDKHVKEHDFETIESIIDNVNKIAEPLNDTSLYYTLLPKSGGYNWSEKDQRAILTGKMPYDVFNRYKSSFEGNEVSRELIPQTHYERRFIKNLVVDNDGLHRIGLFDDYTINTPLDQKIYDLARRDGESDPVLKMEESDVHELSEVLKQKAKENFRQYNGGSRAMELYEILEKKDFEDLMNSGINITEINPVNLPRYMDTETRGYLVGLWKNELEKNGRFGFEDRSLQKIYDHFTVDDFEELIAKGVPVHASEVDFGKMRELGESSLILFPAFRDLSSDKQNEFKEKIKGTEFFEMMENSGFYEDRINGFINQAKDLPKDGIKKSVEREMWARKVDYGLMNSRGKFFSLAPEEKEEFIKKVEGTNFLDLIKYTGDYEQELNNIIDHIKSLPPSEVEDYVRREVQVHSIIRSSVALERSTVLREMSLDQREDFLKKIEGTNFLTNIDSYSLEYQKRDYYVDKIKDLSGEAAKKYLLIQEKKVALRRDNYSAVGTKETREETFDLIKDEFSNIQDEENIETKKLKINNIEESFRVLDDRENLPEQIRKNLEDFEYYYGNKGKHLIALAIVAYGVENPESFSNKMKVIEDVLNKYNPVDIPEGAHVSMGIEYEVTGSIEKTYENESLLGYKSDIELVSRSANIGKGTGGIHEIATKPTYNPYLLLAEMKLLQEAGFLDLNFEKYPQAPRGYHLSLGGEEGLVLDENASFLNNLMTMTQLTGVMAGKEVRSTKQIHTKQLEMFEGEEQKGARVEMKGMACDSVEQFEKAILTAHHAGIAIQLCNKYMPGTVHLGDVPDSSEKFEEMLKSTGTLAMQFESEKERDIVYEWNKLKKSIAEAIGQHNKSFVDSEFNGFTFDKDENYIDTGEHIDVMRNRKLVDEDVLKSQEFQDGIHLNIQDMYEQQNPNFVNALVRTNDIFLKGPQGGENSSINAKSVLDTQKAENYGGILDGDARQSIFDNGGELRNGYYYIQGASEEMISHKSQILLNHFNNQMEKLLQTSSESKRVEEANFVTA